MAKFRVLRGRHAEGRHPDEPNGRRGKQKVYYRGGPIGDIVDSESDLLKHNHPDPGVQNKFELVGDDAVPNIKGVSSEDTSQYEDMTVAELRAHAEEEEIDLGDAKKKADIIKALSAVSV